MRPFMVLGVLGLAGCMTESGVGDLDLPDSVLFPNPPGAEEVTDVFVQVSRPVVDVLFTVDNTGTMGPYHQALGNGFGGFVSRLQEAGTDFHVGVITTDMEGRTQRGRLQPGFGLWVDTNTPAPETTFAAVVRGLGTQGSPTERGLDATFTALELLADDHNAGFRRDQAPMHTVVVSDAPSRDEVGVDWFVEWYTALAGPGGTTTFSSIVDDDGGRYLAVTDDVGGLDFAIDDVEWNEAMVELGKLVTGTRTEFFLSRTPVVETIEVWIEVPNANGSYTRTDWDTDTWTYLPGRNSIRLDVYVPEPLARVHVRYTARADTAAPAP